MTNGPKPICFMVTPFGVKKGEVAPGVEREVNFDRLWVKLFEPLIVGLGYEAVRADVDLGASIIRDMIERLALSDLVIADVTLPNANVFYEVGVRHAACPTGCVLVGASWSKQPFDVQSMRHESYTLAGADVTDDEVRANLASLAPRVVELAESKTPCYEMDGFPKLSFERAQAFREWLLGMSAFNAKITAVRLESDRARRTEKAKALVADLRGAAMTPLALPAAYELLKLVRDSVGWKEAVEFVDELPESMRRLPLMVEQRALACSKSGGHLEAIAALLELIKLSGESPERQGLIGGRFKRLWRDARASKDPSIAEDAIEHLDKAIEHYERGRLLDLNAYYASSNLPLLLRTRNGPGDSAQAARIAVCVVTACERAIELQIADEWVYPTLLGAAFHSGDVSKARELMGRVRREPAPWKLGTTRADLEDAVALQPDESVKAQLAELVARLPDVGKA